MSSFSIFHSILQEKKMRGKFSLAKLNASLPSVPNYCTVSDCKGKGINSNFKKNQKSTLFYERADFGDTRTRKLIAIFTPKKSTRLQFCLWALVCLCQSILCCDVFINHKEHSSLTICFCLLFSCMLRISVFFRNSLLSYSLRSFMSGLFFVPTTLYECEAYIACRKNEIVLFDLFFHIVLCVFSM